MGNCQAVDAAALVIQHPNGKIEKFYWPVSANEVMRNNPGHYVSLIIPLPKLDHQQQQRNHHHQDKTVLFTHVKLLRPNENLTLGHAYRLITTQEVVKVLRARKHAKMRKTQGKKSEMMQTVNLEKLISVSETGGNLDTEDAHDQAIRADRQLPRPAPVNPTTMRPKPWRPSLQSISEAGI